MPLIPIDGIRLMVDDTGSGDPLVLVHGSWDDRRVWAAATDELSRSFRVITYDRRGHTDSEDGSTPGTRRDDEDDLVALIETLELAPAHVVANSFGGAIAVGLAARQPELLRSLSVHEPPLFPLAGEDVIPEQVGEVIGDVVAMIDRGEREEAARVFVEQVALGPGAWDYVPPEDRTMMIGNAGTFTGEQRDPAWRRRRRCPRPGRVPRPAYQRRRESTVLRRGRRGAVLGDPARGGADPSRRRSRPARDAPGRVRRGPTRVRPPGNARSLISISRLAEAPHGRRRCKTVDHDVPHGDRLAGSYPGPERRFPLAALDCGEEGVAGC
ncbi:MAG: alpha/beta fold hydrolase [Candidatus Limnocylindria bacterium]